MAEGKKSFLLYCDMKHTVDLLDDASAGKLFKHLLRYVNDENPETDDTIVKIAFEPIKQQLKRDLKDWEEKREKRVNAGIKGGVSSGISRRKKQKEAMLPSASKNEANEAVNVTVNGNVNGTVTHLLEEVGSERVKEVANEVWKDDIWKGNVCAGLMISLPDLKKWLSLFNSSVSSDVISDFNKGKYKKMSRGWIVKQIEKGVKLQSADPRKSDSPTLTVLNHQ